MKLIDFIVKKNNQVQHNNLAIIVTGMEHSGTTFLANILNNCITNIGGGFECGILLSDKSPSDFVSVKPFYDWFCLPKKIGHWGFTEAERDFIISTNSWDIAYNRLLTTYFKVESEKPEQIILDKTPAYCYNLNKILKRTSNKIPVLITIKNIHSLFYSFKKRNIDISEFSSLFLRFVKNLKKVKKNKRILLLRHDTMVQDTKSTIEKIKIMFPEINIDLGLLDKTLNYSLNPLCEDYDLAVEDMVALNNISKIEKRKLDSLNSILMKCLF
jgi:hypothetical protein